MIKDTDTFLRFLATNPLPAFLAAILAYTAGVVLGLVYMGDL